MLGFFLIQNIPGDEFKLQTSHANLAPGADIAQHLVSSIANKGKVRQQKRSKQHKKHSPGDPPAIVCLF